MKFSKRNNVPAKPAINISLCFYSSWQKNARHRLVFQDSLVVRVGVRAGAGLAVLWSASGGVAEEAGGALLTELTLCVMQAALAGEAYRCLESCPSWLNGYNQATTKSGITNLVPHTAQMPVSGWQESEWPLHSQSSQ